MAIRSSKFDPKNVPEILDGLTDQDKKFVELVKEYKNKTRAYKESYDCTGLQETSIRTYALKQAHALGVGNVGRRNEKRGLRPKDSQQIVQHVKKMFAEGQIDESKLYRQMSNLAYRCGDVRVNFYATKELREWYKEAKSDIDANRLTSDDIVSLMIEALGDLPRGKYIRVLKGVRARRLLIMRKRTAVVDPEAILAEARSKMVNDVANPEEK